MRETEQAYFCDNCRKMIPRWGVQQLVMRQYSPGKNFERCRSNIDIKCEKICDLCPECMQEVRELYCDNRE